MDDEDFAYAIKTKQTKPNQTEDEQDALGVMVVSKGSGHGDTSSNHWRGCLHFELHFIQFWNGCIQ